MIGVAAGIGIDDEGAVHPLVDMPLKRQGMAVIEMAAERKGVELVCELLAWGDLAGAGNSVHPGRMDAVEMHGMAVRAVVPKDDANPIAFGDAQARSGDAAVIGPGRKEDPRSDLDLLVLARYQESPSVRPSGRVETVPVSQSVRSAVGSKPLRALSTSPTVIIPPWAP